MPELFVKEIRASVPRARVYHTGGKVVLPRWVEIDLRRDWPEGAQLVVCEPGYCEQHPYLERFVAADGI